MPGGVPKARISRGGKLGRLAAEQAVRTAGTRLSMIGRSKRAKSILAERATIESADQLVTVLGGMKGAAMKLGQMLSVLDLDMVPVSHRERFREKLAALRDHAPTVSFSSMRDVIQSDIGPLAATFADFDETPIAAASIGQVYRAKLRDGRDVAVKVQYPGVDTAIKADMRNLALFAKLGKTVWPTLGASGFLEEIARNIESELDYLREARTQHYVSQNYSGHPFIQIPDSIPELSGARVLVTEYIDGMSFDALRTVRTTSATTSASWSSASTSVRCSWTTSSAATLIPATSCGPRKERWASSTSACSTGWIPPTSTSNGCCCAPLRRAGPTIFTT